AGAAADAEDRAGSAAAQATGAARRRPHARAAAEQPRRRDRRCARARRVVLATERVERERLAAAIEPDVAIEHPQLVAGPAEPQPLTASVEPRAPRRLVALDLVQIPVLDVGLLALDRLDVDRIDLKREPRAALGPRRVVERLARVAVRDHRLVDRDHRLDAVLP